MLKRSAIFVHRWLGVALCLLFLLWFPSGIGMMYWDFPGVSAGDRLDRPRRSIRRRFICRRPKPTRSPAAAAPGDSRACERRRAHALLHRPEDARVVGSYSSRTWTDRWLHHALHSLDFPWLYAHRPLWDIVVITFMLGGTALCVTSLILAWRVIGTYFFGGGVQRAGLSAGPLSR